MTTSRDSAGYIRPRRTTLLAGVALATLITAEAGCALAGKGRPQLTTFAALTVPPGQLPRHCGIARKPSVALRGGRVRSGLWTGLPVPTNPWSGRDEVLMATIRSRVEPPVWPDGPPLSRAQAAAYRLRLAEGVEAAYTAFYTDGDASIVAVYALEFAADRERSDTWSSPRSIRATQVDLGRLSVWVSGHDSACFRAIAGHITSLQRTHSSS